MKTNVKVEGFSTDVKHKLNYAAPLELLFSLNALVAPENHSECENWAKEKYASLDEALRKEIDYFAEHYENWYYITDLAIHLTEGLRPEECTVERVTDDMLKMEPAEFARHFLGMTICDIEISEIQSWLKNPNLVTKESLREQSRFLTVEDVKLFCSDPETIRNRVVNTILLYWDKSFRFEWAKLEAFGRKALQKEEMTMCAKSIDSYLLSLHQDISVEDEKLIFDKEPVFSIPLSQVQTVYITLSVFIGSYLGANIIGNKVCVTKALSFQAAKIEQPVPSELIECLKACSDETRLKILKIFWHGKATTQELAKVLDLSPSTVSLHLKQLKAAGLVDSYKVNKFAYYFIKPNIIKKLSDIMQEYFEN